jgi:hypothetical protein
MSSPSGQAGINQSSARDQTTKRATTSDEASANQVPVMSSGSVLLHDRRVRSGDISVRISSDKVTMCNPGRGCAGAGDHIHPVAVAGDLTSGYPKKVIGATEGCHDIQADGAAQPLRALVNEVGVTIRLSCGLLRHHEFLSGEQNKGWF